MKEKIVDIWGLHINYKIRKNKENKNTIVILHWWWGSSDSWDNVSKILYKNGYNVIVPDLPGFWKTMLDQPFKLCDYAKVIEDFIASLKIKNIILMWHSNGWAISTMIISRGFLKINKLILNNSAGIRNKKLPSLKNKIIKYTTYPFKIFKKIPGYQKVRRFIYIRFLGWGDYINSENNKHLNDTLKNMLKADIKAEFKSIKIPTLIIWWENDAYTPLLDWYKMKKWISNSKIIILDKQRHSIHLQAPDLLVQTIIKNI